MVDVLKRAYRVVEQEDPAEMIRARLHRDISGVRIGGLDVLVGVYEPSKDAMIETAGGVRLIMTDKMREEWRWQGVVGLVLKMGPLAYKTDKTADWFCDEESGQPNPPAIGQWVAFDVKDTHQVLIGEQPCRLVACQDIRLIVERPDLCA